MDSIKEGFVVIVDFKHKDSFDKILKFALKMKKLIIIGTASKNNENVYTLKCHSGLIKR